MVLFPAHGPDPERPLEAFDDGDAWFQLIVAPALLPIRPVLQAQIGGFLADVAAMLWEEGVGTLALRFDHRYKVMVLRKAPVPWSWRASRRLRRLHLGTGIVAVQFASNQQAALDSCERVLRGWQTGTSYRDAPVMSARDVLRAIRQSRRGKPARHR